MLYILNLHSDVCQVISQNWKKMLLFVSRKIYGFLGMKLWKHQVKIVIDGIWI